MAVQKQEQLRRVCGVVDWKERDLSFLRMLACCLDLTAQAPYTKYCH